MAPQSSRGGPAADHGPGSVIESEAERKKDHVHKVRRECRRWNGTGAALAACCAFSSPDAPLVDCHAREGKTNLRLSLVQQRSIAHMAKHAHRVSVVISHATPSKVVSAQKSMHVSSLP